MSHACGGPTHTGRACWGPHASRGSLPRDTGLCSPGTLLATNLSQREALGIHGSLGRAGAVSPPPGQVQQKAGPTENWAAGAAEGILGRGPGVATSLWEKPTAPPHVNSRRLETHPGQLCATVREAAAGCP